MSQEADYYAILGVGPTASPEMVQDAFTQILSHFPSGTDELAQDPAYQQALNAYKVLSDPKRRATYDSLRAETFSSPLQISIQTSRNRLALSETAQLIYMLAEIQSPEQHLDTRRPLNISLVIDRSTSMQGARMQNVKTAVELILSKLMPDDTISVISFSDRAEVILPAGKIKNAQALMSRIRGIQPSGGTEMFQGLQTGVQEMRRASLNLHTNHIILLTDGHTYGDADQCLKLAKDAANQGIGISAFGIGTEWNDKFLDKLVSPSGGYSGFIETPEEIISFLQKSIDGLGNIYAHDVRLLPRFPQDITLQYGFRLTPHPQPAPVDEAEIKLGNLEGHSPLSVLLELAVPPLSREARFNLPLKFTAVIPKSQTSRLGTTTHFGGQVQLFVLRDPPLAAPSPDLVKAVRLLNLYRMNERVWEDVKAGDLDNATRRMRYLSTRLLEAGKTQLAQQAFAETERLATIGQLSGEGRKRLKYGTRAMLAGTLSLDESS